MSKKSFDELSQLARMNEKKALVIIDSKDTKEIPKKEAMPLSKIIPNSIWRRLNQGQKGFVGKVFYNSRKKFGFEFVKKGISGTTNLYRLVDNLN